jgi:hypothetical protein
LDNIRHALTHANRNQLIRRIGTFSAETGMLLTLGNFLNYHRLELDDLYKKGSWARLCTQAGVKENFQEPDETIISKGLRRMCHHNSPWQLKILITTLQAVLAGHTKQNLSSKERAVLTMFAFTLWNNRPLGKSLDENLCRMADNPTLLNEAVELASYLDDNADTLVHKPDLPYFCPLSVHGC